MDPYSVPPSPTANPAPPAAPTPTVVLTQAEIDKTRSLFAKECTSSAAPPGPSSDGHKTQTACLPPAPAPTLAVPAELKTCLDFTARLMRVARDLVSLKQTWKTYPLGSDDTALLKSLVSRMDAGMQSAEDGLLHALGAANTANQWRLNDLIEEQKQ